MAKELDVKVKLKKDEKKNTSLRLKGKTLKALKVRAIEDETSVQQIIETLIETYLKSGKPSPDAPGAPVKKKSEKAAADAAEKPKTGKGGAAKDAAAAPSPATDGSGQDGTKPEK